MGLPTCHECGLMVGEDERARNTLAGSVVLCDGCMAALMAQFARAEQSLDEEREAAEHGCQQCGAPIKDTSTLCASCEEAGMGDDNRGLTKRSERP